MNILLLPVVAVSTSVVVVVVVMTVIVVTVRPPSMKETSKATHVFLHTYIRGN